MHLQATHAVSCQAVNLPAKDCSGSCWGSSEGHVVLKPIRDGGRGVFFENKSSYLSEADIFLCARFFRATSRQI